MKQNRTINLCFVLDDGYSLPTCVSIFSALDSKKKDSRYIVYLLCNKVSSGNKKKILELSREDFEIKVVDIDSLEKYSYLKKETLSATPTSICKFFIPSILNDLDRVIYLDGDIIVRKDLTELFETNIDDRYLAAVKDLCGIDYSNYKTEEFYYFNSGVMLMNLRELREDGMPDKMLEYRLNGYNDMMDQDTLNYVLKEKTVILPLKYNTQVNMLSQATQSKSKKMNLGAIREYYGLSDDCSIERIIEDAVVIHYATSKPWKYYDVYCNTLWERSFVLCPYGDVELSRKSLLADSTTFRVGRALLGPFIKIREMKTRIAYWRRHKFLNQFIKTSSGWKCNKEDIPKCKNYRGEK